MSHVVEYPKARTMRGCLADNIVTPGKLSIENDGKHMAKIGREALRRGREAREENNHGGYSVKLRDGGEKYMNAGGEKEAAAKFV